MSLTKMTKSETEANRYELEFSVDRETFAKALDASYRKNGADITVPGFRKGKAPRALIEKMYGKGVFYDDAINEVLPEAYEAAIKESALEVVGRPEFDIVSVGDEGLVLKAVVYVKPEVKIEGYLGIEADKKVEEVTDEAVEAEINRVRERNGRTVDVTDRAAIDGDAVTIDFDGYVDGVAFDGGKAEGFDLRLGSGQFIPGFEAQIVGHAIGDAFDVNVEFPAEYHAEELAGKPAVFKVVLHAIKATELPALDDEFAKDVSEFDTLAEYQADVRAKIQDRNEKTADAAFENAVIDALVERMEADIPEVMFQAEAESMVHDYENRMRMQGLDLETYFRYTGMTMEGMMAQMRPQAEKQVRVRLALEAVAKAENIEITEEQIAEEYQRIADAYSMPVEQVQALVETDGIVADLKVKAAMDLVKEKAVIR